MKRLLRFLLLVPVLLLGTARTAAQEAGAAAQADPTPAPPTAAAKPGNVDVLVIRIEGPISTPNLYVLRRGIKGAIDSGVKNVVLDINTPGGRVDIMLKMLEVVHRFDGRIIAFVNSEAISAGAYLAMVCDEVWFTPEGIIGAAAAVQGGGQEIPETMRLKIESYLSGRVRAYLQDDPYRADLLKAMSEEDFELKVGDVVIKPAGELLTLTAKEASRAVGEPSRPLLSSGEAATVEELLDLIHGSGGWNRTDLVTTWAEEVAKVVDMIAPVVLGLAFLLLTIEFKTPGWGVLGTTGLVLLVLVFLSNYVAGLAGHEALLLALLGLVLIGLELFVFPGMGIFGLLGLLAVGAGVVWSLSDIWPTVAPDGTPAFTLETFGSPLIQLLIAILIAVAGLAAVWRLLPKTSFWSRMVLAGGVKGVDPVVAGGGAAGVDRLPDLGATGVAVTPLRPAGEIEVEGRRYEATLSLGSLPRGARVVVVGYRNLALEVEPSQEGNRP